MDAIGIIQPAGKYVWKRFLEINLTLHGVPARTGFMESLTMYSLIILHVIWSAFTIKSKHVFHASAKTIAWNV